MIIFIHECGHILIAKVLGFEVERMEIYPYGGCSKLKYEVNTSISKEFLVLIAGPISQVLFILILSIFLKNDMDMVYQYHFFILGFNLLPIYPLDGGRIFHLGLCLIFSYYRSLQITIYASFFFSLVLSFSMIYFYHNFIFLLIILSLGYKLTKEINQIRYYYQKFLIERYLNKYSFKKVKMIKKVEEMKKGYYHYFMENNFIIKEEEYLKNKLCL